MRPIELKSVEIGLGLRDRLDFGTVRPPGQIAAELFVSEATIGTHVGHVVSKLDARSRMQAVVVADKSGLVRRVCLTVQIRRSSVNEEDLEKWPRPGSVHRE
jgi:hypothetical protein